MIHTLGYPLPSETFGGGFIYGMAGDVLDIGLVTGLDYANPTTDPHNELQRMKLHPAISPMLEGGKTDSLRREGDSRRRALRDAALLRRRSADRRRLGRLPERHAAQGHPSRHEIGHARRRDDLGRAGAERSDDATLVVVRAAVQGVVGLSRNCARRATSTRDFITGCSPGCSTPRSRRDRRPRLRRASINCPGEAGYERMCEDADAAPKETPRAKIDNVLTFDKADRRLQQRHDARREPALSPDRLRHEHLPRSLHGRVRQSVPVLLPGRRLRAAVRERRTESSRAACRSTSPTACTARRATSWTRIRSSRGSRRKAAKAPSTRACSVTRTGGDVVVVGAGLIGLGDRVRAGGTRGERARRRSRRTGARRVVGRRRHARSVHGARRERRRCSRCARRRCARYPAFVAAHRATQRRRRAPAARRRRSRARSTSVELERAAAQARDACDARRRRVRVLDRDGRRWPREPWLGAGVRGALFVERRGLRRQSPPRPRARRGVRGRAASRRANAAAIAARIRRAARARRAHRRGFVAARSRRQRVPAPGPATLEGVPPSVRTAGRAGQGADARARRAASGFVRAATWVPGGLPRAARRRPAADRRDRRVGRIRRARHRATGVHDAARARRSPPRRRCAGFTLSESWAGLRPGTPDGLPFLGPTRDRGLSSSRPATIRNGILLTPATARSLADAIEPARRPALEPFLDRAARARKKPRAARITHA